MVNVEAQLIAFLSTVLPEGVPVYADVPSDRPETFVTVEADGGSSTLFTSTPMVSIQCWAPTRYEASELAYYVHGVLPDAADASGNGIARVERGAPYNFPDEAQPRYQFIADIHTV